MIGELMDSPYSHVKAGPFTSRKLSVQPQNAMKPYFASRKLTESKVTSKAMFETAKIKSTPVIELQRTSHLQKTSKTNVNAIKKKIQKKEREKNSKNYPKITIAGEIGAPWSRGSDTQEEESRAQADPFALMIEEMNQLTKGFNSNSELDMVVSDEDNFRSKFAP